MPFVYSNTACHCISLHRLESGLRVRHSPDTDLFFALRGAGASYAIATEFVYKIADRPSVNKVPLVVQDIVTFVLLFLHSLD